MAHAFYVPAYTEAEAHSEGWELEDYESETLEVWPDNERAMDAFRRVGTRWMYGAMGGVPTGLRWEAIYPLIDRMGLEPGEWDELVDALQVMEIAAIETMRKHAPKPKPQ
ncbi:DUF1799 domain-containing protein [Acidovorax sp. K2F]|uniref:DUF1799 domain-containing protein n=1 Tax=Acidovorax sp. K2F TaxID=2978125 RepID=UPI0021B0CB10|nr:DUF1799 domain-containing protein [Acidovorax sp. K2F]MCT6721656.1 DUF1799 domain-containing protein [Acidovorax sp. K2F]